jgi:sarcosine oxidase subunit alpha
MRARTSRPKDEGQRTKDKVLGRRIDRHPILTFEERNPVSFVFEGRPMTGRRGETIAAALAANGIRLFRHAEKTGRPRGFFCAVGKCASCLMVVDGRPNTMVCMEPLREGVKVERQRGRGRLPSEVRSPESTVQSPKSIS